MKGATLQEALANGMALANGIRSVEKTVAKVKEGIRQVTGQIHMEALVEKRGAEGRKEEPVPKKEQAQLEVKEEKREAAAPTPALNNVSLSILMPPNNIPHIMPTLNSFQITFNISFVSISPNAIDRKSVV